MKGGYHRINPGKGGWRKANGVSTAQSNAERCREERKAKKLSGNRGTLLSWKKCAYFWRVIRRTEWGFNPGGQRNRKGMNGLKAVAKYLKK